MLPPRLPLAAALLLCSSAFAGAGPVPPGEPALPEGAGAVAVAPAGLDEPQAAWARVLRDFARDGSVDYAGLTARPEDLQIYLASLAEARPEAMSRQEALAFWSNAYNAVVLGHVLDRYPGIESVKAVDGFFDELRFPVAGAERTLDEIETAGRDLGDPRIHFAVVCASRSCPDLPSEPLRGEAIDEQLDRLTRRFLADRSKGMRHDPERGTIWLSSIFKWYAGDFTGGSTALAFLARGAVADWVRRQLPPDVAEEIAGSTRVRYLDYDWSLNDRPAAAD